ncbi:MAG: hypothetical protein Tp1125SUR00d2C35834131_6 [Prokaryotic dsDNA virus sp.]|nr:MAG: hypothetical protein Tp1125SUR00d2C35834131_6 [Prokaryotic dsDNA virus sp.]
MTAIWEQLPYKYTITLIENGVQMTKGNADKQQQYKYKRGVVPLDEIQETSKILIKNHPKITQQQADLVHAVLHDGCTVTEASRRIGANKAWAWRTAQKQHVMDYRKELALSVLGWHGSQAMATMVDLLQHKSGNVRLEASRDLMDRAGIRSEPARPTTAVQINFGVD